jgi:hypothetical protein
VSWWHVQGLQAVIGCITLRGTYLSAGLCTRLVKDVVTAMSRCTFRNGRLLYGCCRLQVVSACSAAAVDTEAGGGACEAEAAQVKPSQ